MKRTMIESMLTSAALMALTASLAASQTPAVSADAQAVAQYVTDRLKSELNLTPDQLPKVKALSEKSATRLEALLKKSAADTSAAGDAALVKGMVTTLQESHQELKGLLTPEQWTRHQANRAQRLALNQTEIMAYTLDLTRSQILDVERINMTSANKLVQALDQPAGAPKQTREQMIAAAKPVLDERDRALERILSVPQWKEMQENRQVLRDLFVEQTTVATAKPNP